MPDFKLSNFGFSLKGNSQLNVRDELTELNSEILLTVLSNIKTGPELKPTSNKNLHKGKGAVIALLMIKFSLTLHIHNISAILGTLHCEFLFWLY